MNEKLPLMYTY